MIKETNLEGETVEKADVLFCDGCDYQLGAVGDCYDSSGRPENHFELSTPKDQETFVFCTKECLKRFVNKKY